MYFLYRHAWQIHFYCLQEEDKMTSVYIWIKFIHVVGSVTFIMGHGAAIAFTFRVKKESELERVRAMLDLSSSMWSVYMISWLVLMVAGIANAFLGNWWSQGWTWVSLVLMLVITIWMFVLGTRTYHPMRKAFGMPYREGNTEVPAGEPLPEAERAALIAATRPMEQLVIGYGGYILILWLMIFKPF
jgi:uncharacterized membrane protein